MKLLLILAIFASLSLCEEHPPRKVLVYGALITSHLRVSLAFSQGLVQRGYNVTQIFAEGSKEAAIARESGINVFTFKGITQDLVDSRSEIIKRNDYTMSQLFDVLKFGLEFLFVNCSQQMDQLKAEKFDMYITGSFPDQRIIGQFLETKHFVQVMSFLPEPVMLEAIGSPPFHSSYISFLSTKILGNDWWLFGSDLKTVQQSFIRRFLNFVIEFVMRGFVLPHFDKDYEALLPERYKPFAVEKKRNPDLALILAVEGLYPSVPLPHNAKVVYPGFKQQTNPDELKFSKELEWFYSLNEKIVLIAFGSAMYPTNATMKTICEFVQLKKDYGFILAIKESKRYFNTEVNELLE